MSETKKDGFIKRLFGGKKEGCSDKPSGCCTSDNKPA
jgi:hypothetical protein